MSKQHFFETQFTLILKVNFGVWSTFKICLNFKLLYKHRRQFFTILIIMYYFENVGVFVYGTLRYSSEENTFETATD
jgi:hypothetical protein